MVQVELKRDTPTGVREEKFNVLTAVDYALDFAQQIVLPDRRRGVSQAFHSMWCRPEGFSRIVYMDPDQRWISDDFQQFLRERSIVLLSCATESRWQLGRVEIAQKMAQRVWRTPTEEQQKSSRPVPVCATTTCISTGSPVPSGSWAGNLESPVR